MCPLEEPAFNLPHFAYWNYRVVKNEYSISMIECHYDVNNNIVAWIDAGEPVGDDVDDLIEELKIRLAAAEKAKAEKDIIMENDLPRWDEIVDGNTS